MKNILVVFGGKSVEREISVLTGVLTANALDKTQYNAVPLYINENDEFFTGESLLNLETYKNKDFVSALSSAVFLPNDNRLYIKKKNKLKPLKNISAVINCSHGALGEDGSLYGFFSYIGLATVSSPIAPSSIAMDKSLTKTFLKGLGVKTVPSFTASYNEGRDEVIKNIEKLLSYPVIVKPATLGSSIGISIAKNYQELFFSLNTAFKYCEKALVEKYIENATEINCASYLMDDKIVVSECEKPTSSSEVLTFSDKYILGNREFPAKIDKKISTKIKEITKKVYKGLSARGIIRIDFILDGKEIYLNEINTVPGSLAYYLLTSSPEEFKDLLSKLVEFTLSEYAEKNSRVKTFDGGILSGGVFFGSKGAKSK